MEDYFTFFKFFIYNVYVYLVTGFGEELAFVEHKELCLPDQSQHALLLNTGTKTFFAQIF